VTDTTFYDFWWVSLATRRPHYQHRNPYDRTIHDAAKRYADQIILGIIIDDSRRPLLKQRAVEFAALMGYVVPMMLLGE
jgi:hypothetical protein